MSADDKLFAVTLFIANKVVSKFFYETVFEKTAVFEDTHSVVFMFGEVMINLLVDTEAPSLVAPALVAPKGAGSSSQFTVSVEDVDAESERLASLGVALINGPVNRSWGVRTLLFSDPDGHLWEFAK